MPVTRSANDFNTLTEWTEAINNIDTQYQIFDNSLFNIQSTGQHSVMFDVTDRDTVLLPSQDRKDKRDSVGKEKTVRTYALPLSYFKHSEYITIEDVQSVRRKNTPDDVETIDIVRAERLGRMRRQVDQTWEYMKLQAAKGVCKSPNGVVYADMFAEFGLTQDTLNFELGTAATDVAGKIRQLRRQVRDNLSNGGFMNGMTVYVDPEFYDKLVSHDSIKDAYRYFRATDQARGAQPLRDNLNEQFTFGGVTFVVLDGSFSLPDGSTEQLIEDNTGHVIPNVQDLFRGWVGPSNKLPLANAGGQDMYAWEFNDPKQEFIEMQVETAPLFICTRPKALVKLTTN